MKGELAIGIIGMIVITDLVPLARARNGNAVLTGIQVAKVISMFTGHGVHVDSIGADRTWQSIRINVCDVIGLRHITVKQVGPVSARRVIAFGVVDICLLYTSPSPRDED